MHDLFKINQGILSWLHERANSGIFTTDTALNILTWNRWLEDHCKLKRSDVVGKNLFELYPDLAARNLNIYYNLAIQGESKNIPNQPHSYLIPIPVDNKSKYMLQNFLISPLIYENEVIGTITCIIDVTDNKLIEEQAKVNMRAKEEWEMTFDAVPDLIAILDNQHLITRMNKSMANRLGIKSEDAIGKHCYELVHCTDSPPFACPHSKLLKDGKMHSADVYEKHLNGYFNVTVVPFYDQDKNLIGSVHIAHDISERIETEQLLKNISLVDDLTGVYNR